MFSILILCFVFGFSISVLGQKTTPQLYPDDPDLLKDQFSPKIHNPEHITKKPGHYTREDWQEVIDDTWGWGLSKTQKRLILNAFWETIDEEFACFVNHPDYHPGWWDSLKTVYTDEINNGDPTYGVSRGRFAAIMNYLSMALKDSHTRVRDRTVNQYTLNPGIPLLVVGQYGENGHFGAGLTPLPDSSLLVYKTVESHPLGLEPGDIVLGYDGFPWKELYRELLEAQLPIYFGYGWGNRWGSTDDAFTHSWLMSAGMNWHLFDTLDVVKYSTGDTVHLATSPLIGQNMQLLCTEQLSVPGVPMPDIDAGERSSYGIIEGTQIGYIYVWSWADNIEDEFFNAVNALMNDYETTGLIIDLRLDYPGSMHLANKGFSLLFNAEVPLISWAARSSPNNHLLLTSSEFSYFNNLHGSALSYYDKPIALLTGSGSFSVGDFIALAVQSHPTTRTFGKPVTAAFNYCDMLDLGNYYWTCTYSHVNTYIPIEPDNYLTRNEIEINEDVWLTPDDVALGHDTVVEAAKAWINSQQGNVSDLDITSPNLNVILDPGEDTTLTLTVSNNGTRTLFYSLTPEVDNELARKSTNQPAAAEDGGYDDFGYTWIDSDQPHGPSFNWIDISGAGTPVSLTDDSFVGPIDIGFEFPFYEISYSQLYICSNGLISFVSGTTASNNYSIHNTDLPNNFIAPWWDDLNPSAGGNIYYFHDVNSNCFIVSFSVIPKFYQGQRIASGTFEVILTPNGKIAFNYISMAMEAETIFDVYSATVGIENSNGTDGLEIQYNAPYTIDSLSILITTGWLAVAPSSGYIAPGENKVATTTFNAQHLDPGIYTGNIYLDSNDPEDSCIIIPVTLEVEGYKYLPGDVNMSGGTWPPAATSPDVTYLVNFFRGLPTSQSCLLGGFWCSADANGDCNVIGSDVTKLVNVFRGLTTLVTCVDYPPAWPTPADLPTEAPDGWPNCE